MASLPSGNSSDGDDSSMDSPSVSSGYISQDQSEDDFSVDSIYEQVPYKPPHRHRPPIKKYIPSHSHFPTKSSLVSGGASHHVLRDCAIDSHGKERGDTSSLDSFVARAPFKSSLFSSSASRHGVGEVENHFSGESIVDRLPESFVDSKVGGTESHSNAGGTESGVGEVANAGGTEIEVSRDVIRDVSRPASVRRGSSPENTMQQRQHQRQPPRIIGGSTAVDKIEGPNSVVNETESLSLANSHTIYLPDFLDEYRNSTRSSADLNTELLKKDWLTVGLVNEIETNFPTHSDVKFGTDNTRSLDSFKSSAAKLFPVGRIFCSYKQLHQALIMFLDSWACHCVHHSKSIRCHYSQRVGKTPPKHPDPRKRRKVEKSQKDQVKCPFEIKYSFIDYVKRKDKKLPDIFYHCKITKATYDHTCELSTVFHRQAKQTSGKLQPDLNGLNDVMELLKVKPNLKADTLRPLLLKYFPFYTSIDAQFIVNFRKRAFLHIVNNNGRELLLEDANRLSSKAPVAAEENVVSDDSLSQKNLAALLRSIMQESDSTWEAIRLLENLKVDNDSFDFRVKFDEDGRPEGICFMTTEMRHDLIRFGSILFLDSMKRQYNEIGWPYIAPSIKDSDLKVRVVLESVVVEESHDFYLWIIDSLVDMEDSFHIENIRMIFADQVLTTQFIEDLIGGKETEILLRGDYHHLMNEVFPAKFGQQLYLQLQGHLSVLLKGSKEEFENAYLHSAQLLLGDAEKLSALKEIYQNPKYYAGWYLRTVEGHLFLKGSAPAEQNHSSVSAHLGAGACWSVAEHITHLLERQVHLTTMRRSEENKYYVKCRNFKSRDRTFPEDDELAKKSFSKFAYQKLWVVENKRRKKLQLKKLVGECHVWPCGQAYNEDMVNVIKEGDRCNGCKRRIAYQHQCGCELLIDGKLILSKWSNRWLNHRTYNHSSPISFCNAPPLLGGIRNIEGQSNVDHDECSNGQQECTDSQPQSTTVGPLCPNDTSGHIDECDDNVSLESIGDSNVCSARTNVSFSMLVEKATNLIRLLSTSPSGLSDLDSLFDTLAIRSRRGLDITPSFDMSRASNVKNPGGNPVRGVMRSIPQATRQKRKKSRHEISRSYRLRGRIRKKNHEPSQLSESNDRDFVSQANDRSKNCSVCKKPGHHMNTCRKIHGIWKRRPLRNDDSQVRHKLSNDLNNPAIYPTVDRPNGDFRPISISMPRLMTGVVIHSRLYKKNNHTDMCLECTCLGKFADPMPEFRRQLFEIGAVCAFIVRSKTNYVICEFDHVVNHDHMLMGIHDRLATQESHSNALSQESFHSTDEPSDSNGRLDMSQTSFVSPQLVQGRSSQLRLSQGSNVGPTFGGDLYRGSNILHHQMLPNSNQAFGHSSPHPSSINHSRLFTLSQVNMTVREDPNPQNEFDQRNARWM